MNRRQFLATLAVLAAANRGQAALAAVRGQAAACGIQRFDPRIDKLIAPGARAEVIADGYTWLEGPAWDRRNGWLLFTDIPANAVHRWRPGLGTDLYLQPAGYTGSAPYSGREPGANGLAFDRQGRLTLCQHGDRRIVRVEDDGRWTALASRYRGKRLNSPNDLVYKSDGTLYFTDPPFGLPGAFDDPGRELGFCGVYRVAPGGEPELLSDALRAPNGIAFSPDERTLYITDVDSARPRWLAFAVRPDGTLDAPREFADARPFMHRGPGGPDGLKADHHGKLFAAGPGGVYVFAPDATLLGRIPTGVATANVAFGEDGGTLFICADTRVLRLRTLTRAPG
jgi:gluconolactonase